MKNNAEKINKLANQLKKGDNSVFEELYKLTSSKAYFIALQITGDKHEAEDIVQESYVTMLAKISTLQKKEGFMSWFNCIVANKSRDFLRKKNPKLFDEDDDGMLEILAKDNGDFSPESNIDSNELRTAVMEAIKELSVEKRTCVLMKYFEDMSVNEISDNMDIPVSTVKNKLFAARKELKSIFEKKGITAAYSVAPLGVVTWAINSTYEIVAQSFEGSQAATRILSGIAVAGTGAAVAATSTAAATGTGAAAKIAAMTTAQKIASGVAIAGVVTGSTLGITTAIRHKTPDIPETTAYSETVEVENKAEQALNEIIAPVPDVIVDVPTKEEKKFTDTKYRDSNIHDAMPEQWEPLGVVGLGTNYIEFPDNKNTFFYTEIDAAESGYYSFSAFFPEDVTTDDEYLYVLVPENPRGNSLDGWSTSMVISDDRTMFYLEEGINSLLVYRGRNLKSYNLVIDYLGAEIIDVAIPEKSREIIIGYNESAPGVKTSSKEFTSNYYDLTVYFSSGKVLEFKNVDLRGYIEGGLKDGENTVIFFIGDYRHTDTVTAHYPNYYVKDIEISNLDGFLFAKVGEEGFTVTEPDEYEVTITYPDGRKETFDGPTWDKKIKLDNGKDVEVSFITTDVRDRDALRFTVAIGEYEYINTLCTVTEFDLIGLRKMLDKKNWDKLAEDSYEVDYAIDLLKNSSDSTFDYLYNSIGIINNAGKGTFKNLKAVAGYELDYAITLFKICTENQFDLYNS